MARLTHTKLGLAADITTAQSAADAAAADAATAAADAATAASDASTALSTANAAQGDATTAIADAATAQGAADAAQGDATTAIADAATAQGAADAAQGDATTAIADAATADGKAVAAQDDILAGIGVAVTAGPTACTSGDDTTQQEVSLVGMPSLTNGNKYRLSGLLTGRNSGGGLLYSQQFSGSVFAWNGSAFTSLVEGAILTEYVHASASAQWTSEAKRPSIDFGASLKLACTPASGEAPLMEFDGFIADLGASAPA